MIMVLLHPPLVPHRQTAPARFRWAQDPAVRLATVAGTLAASTLVSSLVLTMISPLATVEECRGGGSGGADGVGERGEVEDAVSGSKTRPIPVTWGDR